MSAGQWVHTEEHPVTRAGVPLAPWPVHQTVPLDVDLVGELLSDLRQGVVMWTELERKHFLAGNRELSDWCGGRADTARDALRTAERLVARANHRAQLADRP